MRDRLCGQHCGILRHLEYRLALLVARVHLLQVSPRTRSRHRWRAARYPRARRSTPPRKWRRPADPRCPTAARRCRAPRAACARQAVAAAGGIDEHGLLQVAAAGGGQEFVAALVAQGVGRSMSWPFAARTQPLSRQHHGDRLARHQRGFVDRLRGLALHQLGARARRRTSRRRSATSSPPASSASPCSSACRRSRRALRELLSARRGSSFPRAAPAGAAGSRGCASACSSESLKRFISTGLGSLLACGRCGSLRPD